MTEDDASALLDDRTYFDYLHGRVMKVDMGADILRETCYDRDNGQGAAMRALGDLAEVF